MRLAQHGEVQQVRRATLRPCSDVVGVHLLELVDARLVVVNTERAQRAVGRAVDLRVLRLLLVTGPLGALVEDSDIE